MLICSINYNFDYNVLTDEQKVVFLDNWPLAKGNLNKDGSLDRYSVPRMRMSMEEVANLTRAGVTQFDIEGVDGTMLTKMRDRGDLMDRGGPLDYQAGRLIQITVADNMLMFVNEVEWEDDCCTQDVQKRLDEGWRILAVCPPNAARRPDYIFGRTKPKDNR